MKLRDYQQESVSALWGWFRANPTGAPLLVLPTGAGKSLVIAEIARAVAAKGKRVLIVAHRKELISQNFEKLASLMPFGSIGMYSAGLGKRDTDRAVIVAGIQSVYKKAKELGEVALVLIDEVHLVAPDGEGRYQTLIKELREINPSIRFCGLTATPYRLGSGVLTESGNLWTDIAHEVKIKRLISEGYLSPLVSKGSRHAADLTTVTVRGGEYVAEQMERAFNQLDIVEAAIEEIVRLGVGRKKWMIFASGVGHAQNIAAVLTRVGITNGVVIGDTPPLERAATLSAFKSGELQALIGCEVLTTGFDEPGIELVAVMRATKSTALWVQICGRGCRIAEGKKDCLILDYGGNAVRLGPIDTIELSYRKNPLDGETTVAVNTMPVKECPECRAILPLNAAGCDDCGTMFPNVFRINHEAEASTAPVISAEQPKHIVDVVGVKYERHKKPEKPLPTLRVDYALSMIEDYPVRKISEWVCLEHTNFAREKAAKWWLQRSATIMGQPPTTIDDALSRLNEIRNPRKIEVQKDGKWWRVLRVVEWSDGSAGGEEQRKKEEEDAFFEETGLNL
ncbi:MAG: DEAD/DEAH box helicase [Hyphomicrobiaceae bacterium]|nr:MAG: DEAD/DEAH box helicase [Hyphomicrobiaceae bacterium]